MSKEKFVKAISGSTDAYDWLKEITDKAQSRELRPWSPPVIELIEGYGLTVDRKKDKKVQANLSFPTSTDGPSMAIGFRHAKGNNEFAEDLYVFEKDKGLTVYYRGAHEEFLPEYADTHHAKIELSEFLPDIQKEIADIKSQLSDLTSASVEYISDDAHLVRMQAVAQKMNARIRQYQGRFGHTGAMQNISMAIQDEATKERIELQRQKTQSDRAYRTRTIPEVTLNVRAQANANEFQVSVSSDSGVSLVAESLSINGIETNLEQQFKLLFSVQSVNIPEDIFDNDSGPVTMVLKYRGLEGFKYKLTMMGEHEHRADERFNIVFKDPVQLEAC